MVSQGFQKSERHPGRGILNCSSWQLPKTYSFGQLNATYFHTSSMQNGKILPFVLTDIGEGINEVTIKEWFVKVEDKVSQFDNICEVQSDKASVTITSRYDGVIKKIYYEVDEIKLSSVPGTGKGGRVLKEDVLVFLNKIPAAPSVQETPLPSSPKSVQLTDEEKMEPIVGIRKAMVKSMTASANIPQFVYSDEISVMKLVNLCAELKELANSENVKLTYMPFFIKAASKALKEFPVLNATVDAACENLIFRKNHNIGVAMDTADGLIVPNIKNVQDLSILEVARELNRLQNLGRKGSLGTEDLTGGTFSLSNIGAVVPKFDEQENIIKARIISVSWSADHRVIDGATMARFSNLWKKYVETPTSLLFN
ncbi:hypothetical protein C0J52_04520 [Blattella germanica]|nr:hypothetical protein C0J52_04520 [Blattella germanica]